MLNESQQEYLVSLIENFVYDTIESYMNENNPNFDAMREFTIKSINEWLSEDEDELNENVISDSVVIEGIVNGIFDDILEDVNEACKKEETDCKCKSDDDEDDDDEDDDEEGGEDMDEAATMIKRKISKIQSILDKRKRATDPKYKMSRKRTLMKAAARGGRVINKKLSKSIKKSYRQGYGKRWENEDFSLNIDTANILEADKAACNKDCDNDNVEGNNVAPKKDEKKNLAKKMAERAKVQKEAIEESMKDVLKTVPSFGTLNEDESALLSESFVKLLSENVDKAIQSVIEDILEDVEQYKTNVIVPEFNEKVNNYLKEEVIPSLERDANDYFDYVVNEKIEEIMESGAVYKSRDSIQLEQFRDKLLALIEETLYIVPEQEDALIAMERKCDSLTESLKEAHVERIKMRNRANMMENRLWIQNNMPFNISEATEEAIREKVEEFEYEDNDKFITECKKIFNEYLSKSKISSSNTINEEQKQKSDEYSNETIEDIVTRTLKLMKR